MRSIFEIIFFLIYSAILIGVFWLIFKLFSSISRRVLFALIFCATSIFITYYAFNFIKEKRDIEDRLAYQKENPGYCYETKSKLNEDELRLKVFQNVLAWRIQNSIEPDNKFTNLKFIVIPRKVEGEFLIQLIKERKVLDFWKSLLRFSDTFHFFTPHDAYNFKLTDINKDFTFLIKNWNFIEIIHGKSFQEISKIKFKETRNQELSLSEKEIALGFGDYFFEEYSLSVKVRDHDTYEKNDSEIKKSIEKEIESIKKYWQAKRPMMFVVSYCGYVLEREVLSGGEGYEPSIYF